MDRSTSEALRQAPGPLSHREIRSIIGGIIVAMLLAALDQTIVATALPTIGRELGDVEDMPWVVTAYLLASTAVTPLLNRAGGGDGRRDSNCRYGFGRSRAAMSPEITTASDQRLPSTAAGLFSRLLRQREAALRTKRGLFSGLVR